MDIDELQPNRRVAFIIFITGAVLSFFTEDFFLDFPSVKKGLTIGVILGLLWIGVRYKANGIETLDVARKDFGKSIVYAFSFIFGFFIFYGLKKFILFLI